MSSLAAREIHPANFTFMKCNGYSVVADRDRRLFFVPETKKRGLAKKQT